jgi:hypothetical protein
VYAFQLVSFPHASSPKPYMLFLFFHTVPLKHWYLSMKLQDICKKKTVILGLTTFWAFGNKFDCCYPVMFLFWSLFRQSCVGLTTLPPSCADCLKIWEPHPPGTLRACQGLQWDCFTFRQSSGYCTKLWKTKLQRIYALFEISQLKLIHYNYYYYWYHDTSYSVLGFVKSSISKSKLLNQLICYYNISRNDNCNEGFVIMRLIKVYI